jgi:hypothetical protein
MTTSMEIETQGEHPYVVRLRDDDEACETWFTITPRLVGRWSTSLPPMTTSSRS